ncbi:hypothetical protein GCM10027020_27140 [Nocardioides salsibiostraticola]
MRSSRVAGRAWATAALAAGLMLTACSATSTPHRNRAGASISQQTTMQFREQTDLLGAKRAAYNSLPSRPKGVVTIDGVDGSLTSAARTRYRLRSGSIVDQNTNGDSRAFDRLCSGEIDLVDSSRSINAEEFAACREVGLDVVQFQVASDAVVLAIKSATDVGGDCLSTHQVRDTFRAGSPVTNWAQSPLGLSDVPLKAGGPDPASNAFRFLGRTVLESTQAGLSDFRSDYRPFDIDEAARVFVAGNSDDARPEVEVASLERERNNRRTLLARAEVNLADAVAAQRSARSRQQVVDANAEVAQRTAERNAIFVRFKQARATYLEALRAKNRFDAATGNVAFFRFPYYEAHEDRLRPFEITLPDGRLNCVLPSRRTILDGTYPLSRQMLLTTTVRSLDRVEVKGFMDFFLDESNDLAREVGLVALSAGSIRLQRSWISADDPPTLDDPDGQDEGDTVAPPPPIPEDTPAR